MSTDALGQFLVNAGKVSLFQVRCRRPEESLTKEEKENRWDWPRAYVAGSSLENASLKAIQYFNQKHGVNDYIATEVSLYASSDNEKDVFIN